jgi:xanthine dehydrogenase accessory factor
VEIMIQPVLPAPCLLVFGLSPTARALVRLGKAMGYEVLAVDPAANAAAFPEADGVFTDPAQLALEHAGKPVFAVVVTHGLWDEDAVLTALRQRPEYLGVVASPKRFAELTGLLAEKADAAALGRIKSPAGLDLGGRLPEEVALSILAQIVKERRVAPRALPLAMAAADTAPSAKDPVCGMSVQVSGAKHRALHQGHDYFFCCGGCRERFLAAPDKYLAVGAQG